ncbi:MAG TPA: hypothetical protein PKW78_05870 [Bacteroidales bacterium]|mgnify:CR=1 FL=1|nr:hypothetical protein [Bacteroidales bacterium]
MMVRYNSTLTLLFLLTILPVTYQLLNAQDYTPVVKYYMEQSSGYSPLYNGKIPPPYNMRHEGTYFLESEEYMVGTVVYNGKLYVDVHLNLNTHLDELYIKIPLYNSGSSLLKAHVESFTMKDMQFINIVKEKWPGAPQEGYYRILYAGDNISVLKRTVKRMNSSAVADDKRVTHVFEENSSHYILRDGNFYPVKSKSSLLSILSDRRKELNRHIREEKLNFGKKNRDASLASCAAQYEKEAK